jgi:hypothetical protein
MVYVGSKKSKVRAKACSAVKSKHWHQCKNPAKAGTTLCKIHSGSFKKITRAPSGLAASLKRRKSGSAMMCSPPVMSVPPPVSSPHAFSI